MNTRKVFFVKTAALVLLTQILIAMQVDAQNYSLNAAIKAASAQNTGIAALKFQVADTITGASINTILTPPFARSAEPYNTFTILVQWDSCQNGTAQKYRIYRSITPDTGFTLIDSTTPPLRSYFDRTCEGNKMQWYRITAVNEAGESQPSNEVSSMAGAFVSYFFPSYGLAGAPISIRGGNFGQDSTECVVYFGTIAASIINWSVSSIVATVPRGVSGPVPIRVFVHNATFYFPVYAFDAISPIWENTITINDGCSGTGTLVFGLDSHATDDIDIMLDEAEIPPTPPGGIFDRRFILPKSAASFRDFRSDTSTQAVWTLQFQPGSCGYPLTLTWDSTQLPKGTITLKDGISGTIVNVNMKAKSRYVLTNSGISSLQIQYSNKLFAEIKVDSGWNLVSVPVTAGSMNVSDLFPEASSSAYRFQNGYSTTTSLTVGKGYWLKFPHSQTYRISGLEISPRDVAVDSGWNIIGPFDLNTPRISVTPDPAGILVSNYYGYQNGYAVASTLQSGKGYWIKASHNGVLHFPNGLYKSPSIDKQTDNTSNWICLLMKDQRNRAASLYLSNPDEMTRSYEMPPVPPQGVFDIRFSGNTDVESREKTLHTINLQGVTFPLSLSAVNIGSRILRLRNGLDGKILESNIKEGKIITIAQSLERLVIDEVSMVPGVFQLSQNYPNPFNPSTHFRYSVPRLTTVTLKIYDVLGREVAVLVNADKQPGEYIVEWNAKNLSSGIYFYRLQAGEFSKTLSMQLIK